MTKSATDPVPVNELLNQLNRMVFPSGSRLQYYYADYRLLREQDINANAMPAEMFEALRTNVGRSSALESVPLCATRIETPDVIEVVSGHHRIRAALAAGVVSGIVLLYRGLTNDEIRAKQLAHNSIAGSSDPQLVAEIYNQINSLEFKLESFIDPSIAKAVPDPVRVSQVDINPLGGAKSVSLLFLPTQYDSLEALIDTIPQDTDMLYLASREHYDKFRDAVLASKRAYDVRSIPTVIAHMAEVTYGEATRIIAEMEAAEAAAALVDKELE